MKKAIVLGAGGFIGSHLVKSLRNDGYWVRGADLKLPEYTASAADDYAQGDLRNKDFVDNLFDQDFDEVYQLAADMGGAGYIFTGENDANIMHNSALINLNVLEVCKNNGIKRVFYSSSACIYPQENQIDQANPNCEEKSAYPAHPDSEYGWEKLFSERLFIAYNRNYGMQNRIARYHNIFGPEGTWDGGREKAPAAMCRKVAEAENNSSIEVWGDGLQTRSFLFVDECLEGTKRLLRSDVDVPLNIGSEQMVSINELAQLVIDISGKNLTIKNIEGPLGVRGRNSDNRLIKSRLKWAPSQPLQEGLETTYAWICRQLESARLAV